MSEDTERSIFTRYKKFIENLYDNSRIYRDLVYLSKIVRMFVYIALGVSIIATVLFEKPITTLESLLYLMTKTIPGRILALLIAFCLIIYGLEKPR